MRDWGPVLERMNASVEKIKRLPDNVREP